MLKSAKISDYLSQYSVTWRLTMPSGCPPEDIEIADNHSFFRLTHDCNGNLDNSDLLTYSELDPQRDWGDKIPESLGLSLLVTIKHAEKLLKLPNIRRQNLSGIAEICLLPTDGVVKQTGRKGHYTWWQTTSYSISNRKPIKI